MRNTAKISAIAVSACSPPESSVMVCGFLPGGRARISRPASSGSSLSISCSSAVPPPKRWVKSRWNCTLTTSNAAIRRSRPSRFRFWMALLSLRIASMTSSRSLRRRASFSESSFCSSSARRLTAPSRSRSIFSRSSSRSMLRMSGNAASTASPVRRITSCGAQESASWMRASISTRRSRAETSRSSARPRFSRDSASSESAVAASRSASRW
ncbi:hypothetical protein D9M72_542060 [compost metagenome]